MPNDSFEFSTRLRPGLGQAYERFHRAIPSELATVLKQQELSNGESTEIGRR